MSAPFPGAAEYAVQVPINLQQLESEIANATSVAIQSAALIGPADINLPISNSNAASLWLLPNNLDSSTVNATIAAHVPNPNWGSPSANQGFLDVWGLLVADPQASLTDDQKDTLLRGLATRVMQSN